MLKVVVITLLFVLVIAINFYPPLRISEIHVSIQPERIVEFGPFLITNTLIGSWVAMLVLALLAYFATRRIVDCPSAGSLQNFMEAILEVIYKFMEDFAGPVARTLFPMSATFFLFILTMNWLSLFPGFSSIGIWRLEEGKRVFIPLLRGATTDLNTTVALAILSVGSAQYYGIRAQGAFPYLLRFFRIHRFIAMFRILGQKGSLGAAVEKAIGLLFGGVLDLFLGVLEILEELTKIVSFSFRLFGNVFGGEVLLMVMAFLIPYIISLPFIGLEILTGFMQAPIFAILSTAFAMRAMTMHEDEDALEASKEDV